MAGFLNIRMSADRLFHLGPYPLEELPRDPARRAVEENAAPLVPMPAVAQSSGPVAQAADLYVSYYANADLPPIAPARAPVPDDWHARAHALKGSGYFLDASHMGVCPVPPSAWIDGAAGVPSQINAVVVMLEHPAAVDADNHASDWLDGAAAATARLRAAEIAWCLAGELRAMGWDAQPHWRARSAVDLHRLAILAGVGVREGGRARSPFFGLAHEIAVVTTDYEMAPDTPLAASALTRAMGVRYLFGLSGATSGFERRRRARRASHLGPHPMEQLSRVDGPTTLIQDDKVPRVPKRANFFTRIRHGDLGEKAQREVNRFATKTPLSFAMNEAMEALTPHQDGAANTAADPDTCRDPEENARALKALAYHLGADVVGVCEPPAYAWYSHHADGTPIQPYHRNAVVMLIDQGFDTMEGASGDDWISGAQSMRAYLRGSEIAGVMAEHLRGLGFPARAHTNSDSDLLHIPLTLWAGLGELSRIGELVLNPFLGPRFKTVVLTTDMPLATDKPIDFGLQTFCSKCLKCARECPCDAIPWGEKVMFNGYEMWKPDVERCTRYRVTNMAGSACGRCMKTCPLNKVVNADGPIFTRMASWCGVNAMWLKPFLAPIAIWLDDVLNHGAINRVKKWWIDLELVDGVAVTPARANQRGNDPSKTKDSADQKMAYYPADAMPPPDHREPWPLDRKAALAVTLHGPSQARDQMESHTE